MRGASLRPSGVRAECPDAHGKEEPSVPGPSKNCALPEPLGGRYRLNSVLGTSLVATLYSAEDTATAAPVHLALFDDSAAGVSASSWSWVSGIRHRGLSRVVDGSVSKAPKFLVFESPAGRPLSDELRARGPFSIDDFVHIGMQILLAVGHLHESGIVHQNLGAHSIYMSGDKLRAMRVIVAGLHRCGRIDRTTENDAFSSLSSVDSEIGPESTVIDARDDVLELGRLFTKVLYLEPPARADREPKTRRRLRLLCERCVSSNRYHRPADANVLLTAFLRTLQPPTPPPLELAETEEHPNPVHEYPSQALKPMTVAPHPPPSFRSIIPPSMWLAVLAGAATLGAVSIASPEPSDPVAAHEPLLTVPPPTTAMKQRRVSSPANPTSGAAGVAETPSSRSGAGGSPPGSLVSFESDPATACSERPDAETTATAAAKQEGVAKTPTRPRRRTRRRRRRRRRAGRQHHGSPTFLAASEEHSMFMGVKK